MAMGQQLLVEAESFQEPGGWKLDTQFIENMGSPYLLAHGLGRPVDDAKTTSAFLKLASTTFMFERRIGLRDGMRPGQPGKFQILVNGERTARRLARSGPTGSGRMAEKSQSRTRKSDCACAT